MSFLQGTAWVLGLGVLWYLWVMGREASSGARLVLIRFGKTKLTPGLLKWILLMGLVVAGGHKVAGNPLFDVPDNMEMGVVLIDNYTLWAACNFQ